MRIKLFKCVKSIQSKCLTEKCDIFRSFKPLSIFMGFLSFFIYRLQEDPPTGVSGAPTDNNIMIWNAVIFGRK